MSHGSQGVMWLVIAGFFAIFCGGLHWYQSNRDLGEPVSLVKRPGLNDFMDTVHKSVGEREYNHVTGGKKEGVAAFEDFGLSDVDVTKTANDCFFLFSSKPTLFGEQNLQLTSTVGSDSEWDELGKLHTAESQAVFSSIDPESIKSAIESAIDKIKSSNDPSQEVSAGPIEIPSTVSFHLVYVTARARVDSSSGDAKRQCDFLMTISKQ